MRSRLAKLTGHPYSRAGFAFIACILLAFLFETREINLAYGISISLSSIFIFVILRMFGLWVGLLTCSVLCVYSFAYLQSPYYELFGILEVIWLGAILNRKRDNMFAYDLLYWLVLGAPLFLAMGYDHFGRLNSEVLLLTMITAANSVFNALTADIVVRFLPLRRWVKGYEPAEIPSYKQIMFQMLIAAVAVPFLIYFVASSWHTDRMIMRDSHKLAEGTGQGLEIELIKWDEQDELGLRLGGKLQVGYLNETIERLSNRNLHLITITDDKHKVLASTEPGLSFGDAYAWREDADVRRVAEDYYERTPQTSRDKWPTEAWGEGSYVSEFELRDLNLKMYVVTPMAKYQADVFEEKIYQFSYLILFVCCAGLFALAMNRLLAGGLSKLAEATTGLPDKLERMEEVEWQDSRIREVRSLVDNFRLMSAKLLRMFQQARAMNEMLREQTMKLQDSEERLHHLAYYDGLTGLPNRMQLNTRLPEVLTMEAAPVAVMFADLNQFKQINDTLGHSMGDLLLQQVSGRFAELRSNSCEVFRLGGDEFVFVVQRAAENELVRLQQRIFEIFEEPIQLGETKLFTTASIGVSLYPKDGLDMETILKNADMAMYDAKEQGGNRIRYYSQQINQEFSERLMLDTGIREALMNQHFCLHYQPKVRTTDGSITGIEALIRWEHPTNGRISPAKFIPFAEASGQIIEIDNWVLLEACRQNKEWQHAGLPKVPISVNISVRHFYQGDLVRTIEAVLRRTGLEASYLCLEITEGLFMRELDHVIEVIDQLRAMGVQFSIDDFGTGYSSLNQLQRLPVYQVKLDRSFIQNIAHDSKKAAIVKAIIDLAHSMKLRVVAEGIETKEELEFFVRCRCDELQGYLFSRAIPGGDFAKHLRQGTYCLDHHDQWGEGVS